MQKLTLVAAFAATAALAAGSAAAATGAFHGEAKLANAVSAPKDVTINGVSWHCEGDTCVGEADRYLSLDLPVRECKRVAAELGAVTAYSSRGREITGGTLKVCNSAAAAKAGDAVAAQK
jgi:hypothetical protein